MQEQGRLFLQAELSHGAVECSLGFRDALCCRKSLIFGGAGACPAPLPGLAEALPGWGQAGSDSGVQAGCLPPLVRGMATEQVAMENGDYSARVCVCVCTGWGGEYRNFFLRKKPQFLMERRAISGRAHPTLGAPTSNPIPIPSSPAAAAPAPPSDSYLQ